MRIAIDPQVCTGHGRCYVLAPDVVEPDEHGHGRVIEEHVPPEHHEAARRAAENCPEGAVTLLEEG
jgi:ferredoxin